MATTPQITILFVFRASLLLFAATGVAHSQDHCKDILTHASRNYMTEFNLEDRKAYAWHKNCGSSSRRNNTGLDAFIDGLSLGFTSDQTRQKQWCDENSRLSVYTNVVQRIENTVSIPALENWRYCMEANSKNLITEPKVSPNKAIIQFLVTNRTANDESITDVFVQSDETSGVECRVPGGSGNWDIKLEPSRTINIDCTRSYVKVERQGTEYFVLPGGTVSITNSLSPFLYGFPEVFRTEPVPEEAPPERIIVSLNGAHIGTKGYWAGGTQSRIRDCGNRPTMPSDKFDLIEVGFREERSKFGLAGGRGICQVAPFCDSHGEFCNEVYYTKACYVNKEWHEWYKATMADSGVAYTKEAVCAS